MRLEFLLQFIIPLTFLAIWALTSLLNRDAQPMPPRPGAGRGPGTGPARAGAGGGFSPSSRVEVTGAGRTTAAGRPASPVTERPVPARWSTAPTSGRPGGGSSRAGGTADEGIVILESESRSPQSSSFSPSSAASNPRVTRASAPAARRGAARGRAASAPTIKPMEQERPRALTGLVGQAMAQKRAKPLEMTPLASPMSPLNQASAAEPARDTGRTPTPAPLECGRPCPAGFADQAREVALLGELLQPPVALRGRRRLR